MRFAETSDSTMDDRILEKTASGLASKVKSDSAGKMTSDVSALPDVSENAANDTKATTNGVEEARKPPSACGSG